MADVMTAVLHYQIGVDTKGNSYGWYKCVGQKTSDNFRLIDITIDESAKTVTAYALGNEIFDMYSDEDCIAYCAKNQIGQTTYTSNFPESKDLSTVVASVVQWFSNQSITVNHWGLKYSGHGNGGSIIGGLLNSGYFRNSEALEFLQEVSEAVGTKLAFVDWGTNCMESSAFNLYAAYQYADYMVASTLERTNLGNYTYPGNHYQKYFTPSDGAAALDIKTTLTSMMDDYEAGWTSESGAAAYSKDSNPQQLGLWETKGLTADVFSTLKKVYGNPAFFTQDTMFQASTGGNKKYDVIGLLNNAKAAGTDGADAALTAITNAYVKEIDNTSDFTWPGQYVEGKGGLFME